MTRLALALTLATAACAPSAPFPRRPPHSTTTTAAPAPTLPATTTTAPAPVTTSSVQAARPPSTTVPPVVAEGAAPTLPDGNAGAGATARASWYGAESGRRTANGDAFDGSSLTYAHLRHPFGTLTRFCHDGRCVVARCNDRGPAAWTGKTFDLSRAAFAELAPLSRGVITVTWEAA